MKDATYLWKLSKEKKAEFMERAKKAGMRLGPWIESMCDRPDHSREDGVAWEVACGRRPLADLQEDMKSAQSAGPTKDVKDE